MLDFEHSGLGFSIWDLEFGVWALEFWILGF